MKIGLNLLHAQPEIGGGWIYISNLVSAIAEFDRNNEYVAFVTCKSECLVNSHANFTKVCVGIDPSHRFNRVTYENTAFLSEARRSGVQCIHWFANTQSWFNSIPSLVTIYDLLAFRQPESFTPLKRRYLRLWIKRTVRKADVLLPMSQATANDLLCTFAVPQEKLVVVPTVLPSRFVRPDEEKIQDVRRKYRLPDSFWLYVAHMYPHKNHLRLLHAYHALISRGADVWPLVLRGENKEGGSDVMKLIWDLNLADHVVILPLIPDEDMPAIYSSASCLVFPSLFEGGGIPLMEALACGCPIIASDIAAARESAADAAIYINPVSVSSIEFAMLDMQSNPSRRAEYATKSVRRASEFKASVIVDRLLKAYEFAVHSKAE